MNGITKQSLPLAVQTSLRQAGCSNADFPDLALRILMSGAIDVSEQVTPAVSENYMQWIVVNQRTHGGTRVAINAMNPIGVAAAILSVALSTINLASCVSLLVFIGAACSAKITRSQAALLIALKHLERAQEICSASAVAAQVTTLLGRPTNSEDVLNIVHELRDVGVLFVVGPHPDQAIECQEATILLPHV